MKAETSTLDIFCIFSSEKPLKQVLLVFLGYAYSVICDFDDKLVFLNQ